MRGVGVALACVLVCADASAEDEPRLGHRGIDFELRPDVGWAFIPHSLTGAFVGADIGLRVNRLFEIALDGAWYAPFNGTPAPAASQPVNETLLSAGADFVFFPFVSRLDPRAGRGIFEPYVFFGLGMIVTRPVAVVDPVNRRFDDQNHLHMDLGIGARLFAAPWLAVNLELRDVMYVEQRENPSVAAGSTSLPLFDPNNPANPATWYDRKEPFTNAILLRLGGSFVLGAR